jgi:hypothetical protein
VAAVVAAAVLACGLSGCGEEASLPDPAAYPAPDPPATRVDAVEALQLEALPIRDTAGLAVTEPGADTGLLTDGLAALRAAVPDVTDYDRISVYDDVLIVGFQPPGEAGRTVSAAYFPDRRLNLGEPAPSTERTFTLDGVDVDAPGRLVRGIEARFPGVRVRSVDLRVGLSYDFGLAWYLDVEDARGGLATVFADPDGTVIAVDAD